MEDDEWFFIGEDSADLFPGITASDMCRLAGITEPFDGTCKELHACAYQLAFRRMPGLTSKVPAPDLRAGRMTGIEGGIHKPIGAKLFLIQKGFAKVLLRLSRSYKPQIYFDVLLGSLRLARCLKNSVPACGGSARHFSLVDGGRMQNAEGACHAHLRPKLRKGHGNREDLVLG
jgi:hypothetical protein